MTQISATIVRMDDKYKHMMPRLLTPKKMKVQLMTHVKIDSLYA